MNYCVARELCTFSHVFRTDIWTVLWEEGGYTSQCQASAKTTVTLLKEKKMKELPQETVLPWYKELLIFGG